MKHPFYEDDIVIYHSMVKSLSDVNPTQIGQNYITKNYQDLLIHYSVFHRYWYLHKLSYWQKFPARLESSLIWLAEIDLTPDGLLYFKCQILHDVN